MEDKIFNVIKEKNAKSAGHYMKILGIIEEDDSVQFGVPKKNLDLLIILSKIGLIENDAECGKTIDNFHDYLYKLGINTDSLKNYGKTNTIEPQKNQANTSAKKKVIKLGPKSEYPLFSTLYRDHDGLYKVETLINEYHDSTLREGMMVGISYGEKFIVEDIQNNRFTKEDILNMGMDEIIEYCDEERDEI